MLVESELTLATATAAGSNLNVFITNRLFGPAIEKAKRLALQDLRECVASKGILQTRQFVPVEAYVEFVDSIFRLVWFCLYRDYFEMEGINQTMTVGKLAGLTAKCPVPTRVYELAIHCLSPVIFKTEIFIPSPELVRCREFEELSEIAPVFAVTLGPCLPLGVRYGVNLRVGMIRLMDDLPGAMTALTVYKIDNVYPVLRNVMFRSLEFQNSNGVYIQNKQISLLQGIRQINLALEVNLIPDDREIPTDVDAMSAPHYIERVAELNEELFPPGPADFEHLADHAWFVPFVYSRIETEQNMACTMSCYLPIVVYTADNVRLNGIRADTLETDFGAPGTYRASFLNALRTDFVAACMQSIKSLRIKEGSLMPRYESGDEVFGVIRSMIVNSWSSLTFPSLDSQFQWTQPEWTLPSDSPFFPYQIKWTRQVSRTLQKPAARKKPVSKVKENVHRTKETTNVTTVNRTPSDQQE